MVIGKKKGKEKTPRADRGSVSGEQQFCEDAAECIRYYPAGDFAVCYTTVNELGMIRKVYGEDAAQCAMRSISMALSESESHAISTADGDGYLYLLRCGDIRLEDFIAKLHAKLGNAEAYLPEHPRIVVHTGTFSTGGKLLDMPVREMVKKAKAAHREASKRTHSSLIVYTDGLKKAVAEERQFTRQMKGALKKRQFVPCLQPKYCFDTDKVEGAEILSRWNHPKKGLVPPYRFIPLFISNGFIVELDTYMFGRVCSIIHHWEKDGVGPIKLSVNVSRMLITSPKHMKRYAEIKKKYKIPDGMVQLEFSERLIADNTDIIEDVFEFFKNEGFSLAVDNYGAAGVPLDSIAAYSIDTVKLFRGLFEKQTYTQEEKDRIFEIIRLSKEKGMKTVAEGVEDEATREMLREAGCDMIQGYVFSMPVSLEDFNAKYIDGGKKPDGQA